MENKLLFSLRGFPGDLNHQTIYRGSEFAHFLQAAAANLYVGGASSNRQNICRQEKRNNNFEKCLR